jgi:glycosyltransferase involved in cell wall biosynthesis
VGAEEMKIVYMSDSPTVPTGYGRVGKVLCENFIKEGHSVTVIGWGYNGEPHDLPYNIIPCNTQTDGFGENILADFIRKEKPDILFTLGDPWMTEYIPNMEERSAVTWISYFPIDGYPIPPAWHNWIKNIDVPVVFSRFAKETVEKEVGRQVSLIYHGVDTERFVPMDKAEIKKEFGIEGKFVVGTVARNQPRKNLPALVKAFSLFAKNKDDVLLYMHSQVVDVGWNLAELVSRFGVTDKAFTTPGFTALKGIPDEELVKIYNMFDIFVLPTMAEGFGLPIIEAQSCEVPVLVTDFSACSELVVDRQELIKVKDYIIMGRNIEQAVADVDDIVRKLNFFYNDWKKNGGKKLKYYGTEGRKNAQKIDWKLICKDFNALLKQVEPHALRRPKKIYPTFVII